MTPTYDYALTKFFTSEEFDFNGLNKSCQEALFKISLSYPELFKKIRQQHPNLISFFTSTFEYYPHYFLLDQDNCDWLVETASNFNPRLLNSLFFYSDWFSVPEENIDVWVEYMLPSLQPSYKGRLMIENNIRYPNGELEQIIFNIFRSCFKHKLIFDCVDGLGEVIENNASQFSDINQVNKQLQSLLSE